MTSSTMCSVVRASEDELGAVGECGCFDQFPNETMGGKHFFRGIMIAIPAGLLLWAGLLRVVGEVLHRL